MTDPFKSRLERWKRALIDLTKRNRLLNYNPNRVTTIQIITEAPAEVFRLLQLDGKSMKFLPVQEILNATLVKDKFLQTALSEEKLNDSLLRIYRKSSSLLEEQGLSTLFMAIGTLEWYDADDLETPLKAPLLLLPVDLTRKLAWQDFSLKTTGDDPVINPALVEQLRLANELLMPELPESLDEFDLDLFFSQMQEIISKQKGWRINKDIYLDFFSFQKFLMYKDMERYEEHYYKSSLIQALCNPGGSRIAALPADIEKADLDQVLLPESTFHVLDADSSQQRAILAVKSKHNLIIEGPPGTGKSQTIANLIADALADKKTVLFVSEKMAALEVVYKRLETIGLHDFCLQLHSHKTNKRAVYDEIIRVLDNTRPLDHAKDADLTQLGFLRDFLNKYAQQLHTPFGKLAEKPFDVLGQLALVLGKAPLIEAPINNIDAIDQISFQNTCSNLQDLVNVLLDLGDPKKHSWYGSELRNISNAELAALHEALTKAIKSFAETIQTTNSCAEEFGITPASTIKEINTLCQAASTIADSPGVERADLENAKWDILPPEAKDLLKHGYNFEHLEQKILTCFKPELLNVDLVDVRDRFNNYSKSWTRFIKLDYWKDRQFLFDYLLPDYKHLSANDLSLHLNALKAYQSEKAYLLQKNEIGQNLFGSRWHGLTSNWQDLEKYGLWLVRMRQYCAAGILQEKAIILVTEGKINSKKIQSTVKGLQEQLGYLVASLQEIIEMAKLSANAAQLLNADGNLIKAQTWLETILLNIQRLHQLTVYNDKLATCLTSIAGPMTERFIEQKYEPVQLVQTFKRFFYERWLDLVFIERPRLGIFNSLVHEQKIDDFRGLDLKSIKLSRQRLLHKLYAARELQLANPLLSIELGILQRELRKKARHIPLRKLFTKVPNITRAVKPCFMMSPMSAALFLDPNISNFDLVIFDEASQVSTEDAVGSLVRAKQAVVVGDPKQLPPTNFFQMQILQADEQAADEDSILDDVDSVLDEFVSIGFPKQSLLWHYRSQHESLIEFSNRHFYKNLLTFPAPHNGTDELGLQFNFVSGIYKGQGVNPIEAKAVADAVCEHIRKHPDLSLGVGTFNMNQQQLILDELEQRRRNDSSLEFFFAKKGEDQFFVKNLENIQGDERDVIFISITYGPDEFGRIRYNFGPVNGENGWRRLNVIFTRAKRCLKVFSSMHGDEIDPAKIQSQGGKLLRDFLIFAEKRERTLTVSNSKIDIDAPFERSVFDELTKRGLKLLPQVGQSGYHIDFGVIGSEDTNCFIAGIECDGNNYYAASTARDRDRLRQKVLEDLGWTIIRVWSIDWWRDKEGQIERVLRIIAQVQNKNVSPIDYSKSAEISEATNTEAIKHNFEPIIQEATAPRKAFGSFNSLSDAVYSNDDQAPSVPPYKLTLLSSFGTAEEFAQVPNEQIVEILQRIIVRETPIHITDISKRVASFWEITRLNKQIKEKLEQALSELVNLNKVVIKGDFIWTLPEPANIVRNRLGLDYVFDPEQVCTEEYEQAVILILEAYGTRIKDRLIQDVARLLGFARAGQKISLRVSDIIQKLTDAGKITNVATGLALHKTESESGFVVSGETEMTNILPIV
jgi:very-short-patch-repair endonuclease